MHRRLALAALLALAPLSGLALDLTPHVGFRELEEIKVPVIELADGAGNVTFELPAGWECKGAARRLALLPPEPGERIVELLLDAAPADPASEPVFDERCRKLLPKLATQVVLIAEAASPFTLRGLPSCENTYTYAFQSRRLTTSFATVEISPGQLLTLVVTASPENFKATHEAAVGAVFTFDWKDAGAAR